MEVGLMEIVRSVNRSWIYDSHFSLYRPIHPGGGKCPGELYEYPHTKTKATSHNVMPRALLIVRHATPINRERQE